VLAKRPCVLENQILVQEKVLEQDTIVPTQEVN
jgi:hypothetical protein